MFKNWLKGVGPHGADRHTNVTRELFLPSSGGYAEAGTPAYSGYRPTVWGDSNADEPEVYFAFKVPDDFISFGSLKAVWASTAASGNMRWTFYINYAAEGEARAAHIEEKTEGVTATAGYILLNIQESPDPVLFTDLAKGDYVGIGFWREGTHADDTLNNPIYLYGLLFTYTAEQ